MEERLVPDRVKRHVRNRVVFNVKYSTPFFCKSASSTLRLVRFARVSSADLFSCLVIIALVAGDQFPADNAPQPTNHTRWSSVAMQPPCLHASPPAMPLSPRALCQCCPDNDETVTCAYFFRCNRVYRLGATRLTPVPMESPEHGPGCLRGLRSSSHLPRVFCRSGLLVDPPHSDFLSCGLCFIRR